MLTYAFEKTCCYETLRHAAGVGGLGSTMSRLVRAISHPKELISIRENKKKILDDQLLFDFCFSALVLWSRPPRACT